MTEGVVRLLRFAAVAVALFVLVLAAGLLWAHLEIRRLGGPLPTVEEIRALPVPADLPIEVFAVDSATQPMPRSLVLDPALDPGRDAPYRMSHPSFLLRWRDGRGLLVDLGMDPDAARDFGRPMEWAGAEPIQPHGPAADALARWIAGAPLGLLFSHLHTDHVEGVAALCRARGPDEVVLFQTPAQAGRTNYTTRPGRKLLDEAGCVRRVPLADEVLAPVPDHPGVYVLYAAGHTPGSQVVIARVRDDGRIRTVVFTGDTVNAADGARHDISKPLLYRLLVVPESDARLGAVRRLLAGLESELGAELAVAHDRLALEALGLLPPSSASADWPPMLRIRAGAGGDAAIARAVLERLLATRVGARARGILASGELFGPVIVVLNRRGDNLTRYRVPGRVPSETIDFDPSALPLVQTEAGPLPATAETVLAHELGHALFKLKTEEAVISEVENPVRVELGLPQRTLF